MGWLDALQRKQKEGTVDDKQKEQDDLELKSIVDSSKKVSDLETGLNEIKEKTKVLDRMTSFLDEQEALKRRRVAEEAAKKAKETRESEDQELQNLALEDPVKAAELIFERKSQPLTEALINTQSLNLRKNIFEDGGDKFEYYTNANADFKSKVDAVIDNLPLANRTNPTAIKNCYAAVLFDHMQEVKEGKLKSRFAATSTTTSGTTSTKDKDTVTLSELQKKAAAALGIKEEDYAKTAKEMNYV